MKKPFIILVCILLTGAKLFAQSWSELGTGTNALNVNGDVYTMCTDIHGNVYVAGWMFDDSEGVSVYKWNGTNWAELGHGSTALSTYWEIDAIYADTGGNVYASAPLPIDYGAPTNDTYYVAKWDGTAWHPLGADYPYSQGGIGAITMDRYGNLYAVGGFIDSSGGYYVAKWDGTSWSEVGTGSNRLNANGYIDVIFIDTSGNIFVAGSFSDGLTDTVGNLYVAKWNGTTWSEIGSGVSPAHFDGGAIYGVLEDTSGNIYAGGWFVNSSNKYYVSKWDGTSWSELGTGAHALNANNIINTMCFDKYGNLYAAGSFTDTTTTLLLPHLDAFADTIQYMDTLHPCYVAKWDGTEWSEVGTGTNALNANGWILSVCTDAAGFLYTGGDLVDTSHIITFSQIDTTDTVHVYAHYVARYGITATGITPLSFTSPIHVYPNPTNSTLNITGITQQTNYRLLSVTGICIQSGTLRSGNNTISINNATPGVYLLEMTNTQSQRNIVRVIKE